MKKPSELRVSTPLAVIAVFFALTLSITPAHAQAHADVKPGDVITPKNAAQVRTLVSPGAYLAVAAGMAANCLAFLRKALRYRPGRSVFRRFLPPWSAGGRPPGSSGGGPCHGGSERPPHAARGAHRSGSTRRFPFCPPAHRSARGGARRAT